MTRPMPDNERPQNRERWNVVLALAGLAVLALALDQPFVNCITSHTAYQTFYPALQAVTGGAGALILIAILTDRFGPRQWLGVITPLLLSTGLTHLLKYVVGRARPRVDLGPFHFEPFTPGAKVASFPSGHTSYAIAVVILLCIHFPRWSPLFIFLGVCAGLERVIIREHYPSDVLAGAAIGAFSVYLSMRLLGKRYYTCETRPTLD